MGESKRKLAAILAADVVGYSRLMGRIFRLSAVGWLDTGEIGVGKRLCRAHCRDQRADAHDIDDALEIVSQHVQRHFGPDPFQRLHLEVG